MGKATRGNYLDDENQIRITSEELYLSKGELGNKPFYNFHGWLDEVPPPDAQADLIQFVRLFSEEVEKGKVPLVDCSTGLQKTATFIAMVELARHRFKMTAPKDDELEGLMMSILRELAKTAKGRIPTMNQLKMVLDPSLLKQLVGQHF
jgi:protein tyrosine phosphatase